MSQFLSLPNFLAGRDAFWQWSGHKHVAELASGNHSDFYANCTSVFEEPSACHTFANELLVKVESELDVLLETRQNVWVVGSAMGAVGLAHVMASLVSGGVKAAYTDQVSYIVNLNSVATIAKRMELKRFDLGEAPWVILCEDVCTTGGTTNRTIKAIREKHPDALFFSKVLVLVNRNPGIRIGSELPGEHCGLEVVSLYEHSAKVWKPGEAPDEMKECIPVRPKQFWKELTTEML